MCLVDWLLLGNIINGSNAKILSLAILIFLCLGMAKLADDEYHLINAQVIDNKIQETNGNVKKRFIAWKKLILNNQNQAIKEKLRVTNDFFNQFEYAHDIQYEGTADYWKTPEEFIVDGGGDCEDFSIAKYFTLLAMGVPLESLRITYVKSLQYQQAHMVLTYYKNPSAEPLVLDNLEAKILPASQRKDLIPVYSFNGRGLWLAKQRGQDMPLGNADHLGKWHSVVERMKGNSS